MSGWGDNKSLLVNQVKEWQRRSAGHKKAWDNFCTENGHPKFDPNLKDESFLQSFLEGTQQGLIMPTEESVSFMGGGMGGGMGGCMGGGGGGGSLIDQVKSIQRRGTGYKEAWWKFCREMGSQDFDPARHDAGTLHTFVNGINQGTIQPEADGGDSWGGGGGGGWGGGKGGGKGGWGGGGGKGGWGGDVGWGGGGGGMDEWSWMAMMKMKGMMKGKGGDSESGGSGGKADGGFAGGGGGGGSPGPAMGEIRYDDPNHTEQALENLNGSSVKGCTISLERDPRSQDGTKLIVSGLPAGMQWQELKDHFSPIGTVAYAGIKGDSGKGAFGDAGCWGKGMMMKGYSPW